MGCGNNTAGNLGTGQTGQGRSGLVWMRAPSGERLTEVVQVSSYSGSSYALLADGSVLAYGSNINGKLGHGVEDFFFGSLEGGGVNVIGIDRQPLENIAHIASGNSFVLAITQSGELLAWGNNQSGELGDASGQQRAYAASVTYADAPLGGANKVAAGAAHALVLLDDGTLMSWGRNNKGQLGTGQFANSQGPDFVLEGEAGNQLTDIVAIAASENHSVALTGTGQFQ